MNEMLKNFLDISATEFTEILRNINESELQAATNLILQSQEHGGRLHITGIGKPSHVATYMASLLSSTGTPTYFLHGTEAVHGSCGQLVPGDVVICISNSGETAELKATATAIRRNGCRVIGVTGNPGSWLGEFSDACICAGVKNEGGPLNRAPRMSIIAEILALQALSILLQEKSGITPQQYVLRHPGGALGALRENEK